MSAPTSKIPSTIGSTCRRGIDVSHWQGVINWGQVKAAGIEFAYIKATDGEVGIDPLFHHNWESASAAGILCGAYHFFRVGCGLKQAQHFVNVTSLAGALPPALDLEVGSMEADEIVAAAAFANYIKVKIGIDPVLYVDRSVYAAVRGASSAASSTVVDAGLLLQSLPLWIAQYSMGEPTVPWIFWQHTPAGTVPGINAQVDLDWWRDNTEGSKS